MGLHHSTRIHQCLVTLAIIMSLGGLGNVKLLAQSGCAGLPYVPEWTMHFEIIGRGDGQALGNNYKVLATASGTIQFTSTPDSDGCAAEADPGASYFLSFRQEADLAEVVTLSSFTGRVPMAFQFEGFAAGAMFNIFPWDRTYAPPDPNRLVEQTVTETSKADGSQTQHKVLLAWGPSVPFFIPMPMPPAPATTFSGKKDFIDNAGTIDVLWSVSWTISPSECDVLDSPVPIQIPAQGGSASININESAGTEWAAESDSEWLFFTSESSGTGPATLTFQAEVNPDPITRQGTITVVAGSFCTEHYVWQTGQEEEVCDLSISATERSVLNSGSTETFNVNAAETSAWTATSSVGWIQIVSGSQGSGAGEVKYTVAASAEPDPRVGSITISAGPNCTVTHTVTQLGPTTELTYRQNFAQFAAGQGLSNQIFIFNVSPSDPATVRLNLRDDHGFALSVELNGEPVQGEWETVIPAGSLRILKVSSNALAVGTAQISSDRPVAGLILFEGSFGVAGVNSSISLESGFLAPVQRSQALEIDTGIAMMNLEDRITAATVTLRDMDGDVIAEAVVELEKGGHLARFVDEFIWDSVIYLGDFRGVLEVKTDGRISATVLQTRPGEFATMPVVGFPAAGQDESRKELFFAQFGTGIGQLFSEVLLLNPNPDSDADLEILFWDDAGLPLTVQIQRETVTGKVSMAIPAKGLLALQTEMEGPLVVGSVRVESNVEIGGVIIFGGSVGVAGVGDSLALAQGFIAPVVSHQSAQIQTGIAVANVDNVSISLNISLLDMEGVELAASQLALEAHGHRARFLNELEWDRVVDLSDFKGLIRVTATGTMASTILQTRPGQLATFPVVPLDQ